MKEVVLGLKPKLGTLSAGRKIVVVQDYALMPDHLMAFVANREFTLDLGSL